MALNDCFKKNKYLKPGEKAAILRMADAYKAQGLIEKDAEIKAVQDLQQLALQTISDSYEQATGEPLSPSNQPPGNVNVPPGEPVPPGASNERKKGLLNRAFEGTSNGKIKAAIEKHGLTYEIESHLEASMAADAFIEEVGIEAAVDAVRKNQIEGGAAAFVWAKAIDQIGEQIVAAKNEAEIDRLNTLEADLISEYDRKSRSGGRFISALQEVYENSDFEYKTGRLVEKYKQNNKGEISPEIEARFKDIENRLNEANKKLKEFEDNKAQREAKEAQDAIAAIDKSVKKEKPSQDKEKRERKRKEGLNEMAEALQNISSLMGGTMFAHGEMSPKLVKELQKFGHGAIKAGEATLENVWEKTKQFIKAKLGIDLPDDYRNEVVGGVKQKILDAIPKPKLKENGQLSMPDSFLRELVANGANTIEKLTQEVMALLKPTMPNLTERQVRDAITKYGKTLTMSQDEISKKLRGLKRMGKYISGKEDVLNQKRPLRSGLQRDKPSDEERRLGKELKELMKDLPEDVEETARVWRTALEATKTRLRNQITDLEDQISTGKKTVKKKGIEYDAEANALVEQRDALRKIIQDMEGNPEMSDEQKIRMAMAAAEKSLNEYERQYNELRALKEKLDKGTITREEFEKQSLAVGPQKKTGAPITDELKAIRDRRDATKDLTEKFKDEIGLTEKKQLAIQKIALRKSIEEYRRRIREGDFGPKKKKLEISPDNELTYLKAEKLLLKEEADKILYENKLKNRGPLAKFGDLLLEVFGLTRIIQSTFDFSFIAIQGLRLGIAHPSDAKEALKTALVNMASPKMYRRWFNRIKVQEWYGRAKASKLPITEPNARLSVQEENFLFLKLIHRLWSAVGLPLKLINNKVYTGWETVNPLLAFERATVTYMNVLRIKSYLEGERKLEEDGKSFKNNSDDYKKLASGIATASARPSLGKLEPIAPYLGLVFYSARNWLSIFKQMTPYMFYDVYKMHSKSDPWYKVSVAQKMYIGDFMKMVGTIGGVLMLISLGQSDDDDDDDEWKIETNPTSSNWLKLVNRNTHIDPWGGRQQMVVLQSRLIVQSLLDEKGKTKHLGVGKTSTTGELFGKMLKNKLSPSQAITWELANAHIDPLTGRLIGPYNHPITVNKIFQEHVQPMFFNSIRELHEDQPEVVAGFLDFMAFIGVSTQVYSKTGNNQIKRDWMEMGNIGFEEDIKDLKRIKSNMRRGILSPSEK